MPVTVDEYDLYKELCKTNIVIAWDYVDIAHLIWDDYRQDENPVRDQFAKTLLQEYKEKFVENFSHACNETAENMMLTLRDELKEVPA